MKPLADIARCMNDRCEARETCTRYVWRYTGKVFVHRQGECHSCELYLEEK